MASSKNNGMTQQIDDAVAVSTRDETTMKEQNNMEEAEDLPAEDRRTKSSAVTTASSESKQTGDSSNLHTSSEPADEETEPTEMFDEADRKYTESPADSNMAVYGSDSFHSDASEDVTVQTDPRRNGAAAVDPNMVEAMGGQFEGSSSGREAAEFHNPKNDTEARYIIDRVDKATTTMEDIDLHPEQHYRDPGSSFQVSARPKESAKSAPDDIAHKEKVQLARNPSTYLEIQEGSNMEVRRRRNSCCCGCDVM